MRYKIKALGNDNTYHLSDLVAGNAYRFPNMYFNNILI